MLNQQKNQKRRKKWMNKYHNTKVVFDGIVFDSKKEKKRYYELQLLLRANEIRDLELQVEYELQPAFKKNGITYRKITYIADFKYFDNKLNKWIVEDTKGFRTDVYKIKKKLFEYKYPELEIREI